MGIPSRTSDPSGPPFPLKSSSFEVWFFQLGVTSRDLWALKNKPKNAGFGIGLDLSHLTRGSRPVCLSFPGSDQVIGMTYRPSVGWEHGSGGASKEEVELWGTGISGKSL